MSHATSDPPSTSWLRRRWPWLASGVVKALELVELVLLMVIAPHLDEVHYLWGHVFWDAMKVVLVKVITVGFVLELLGDRDEHAAARVVILGLLAFDLLAVGWNLRQALPYL